MCNFRELQMKSVYRFSRRIWWSLPPSSTGRQIKQFCFLHGSERKTKSPLKKPSPISKSALSLDSPQLHRVDFSQDRLSYLIVYLISQCTELSLPKMTKFKPHGNDAINGKSFVYLEIQFLLISQRCHVINVP